jgi:hypothetical protein
MMPMQAIEEVDFDSETCLLTLRKAAKKHVCDVCSAAILKGEPYNRLFFPASRATYNVHRGGCGDDY